MKSEDLLYKINHSNLERIFTSIIFFSLLFFFILHIKLFTIYEVVIYIVLGVILAKACVMLMISLIVRLEEKSKNSSL